MSLPGPQTAYTLQTLTETKDSNGIITQAWTDIFQGSGVFQPVTASEELRYEKVTEVATHKLWLDDMPTASVSFLIPKSRMTINSAAYDITGVKNWQGIGAHYQVLLKLVK